MEEDRCGTEVSGIIESDGGREAIESEDEPEEVDSAGEAIDCGRAECIIVLCAVCCLHVVVISDVVDPYTDEQGGSKIVASSGEPYDGTWNEWFQRQI